MTNDVCPNCGLYHNTGSCFPFHSPADKTMTDVDTVDLNTPSLERLRVNINAAKEMIANHISDYDYERSIYFEQLDEDINLLSSRCDELERLAGDALAELEADLKVITHAFAEIDKLPMNGELIGLHSILRHSKDKRIPRAVAALEAHKRKGE